MPTYVHVFSIIASIAATFASVVAGLVSLSVLKERQRCRDAVKDDIVLSNLNNDGDMNDHVNESRLDGLANRDYTSYSINGEGNFGKARLVLEIIRRYVVNHKNVTYTELEQVFPKGLRGVKRETSWGCFSRKEDAEALRLDTGISRHFLKDEDLINLKDGAKIAVSSQWGIGNINPFIERANELGFNVQMR